MGFREDFASTLARKRTQLELMTARLNKCKKSGAFYRYSSQKRNSLISKFNKLTRKVGQLKWQMKLAAVGGTIAVFGNTHDAVAQSTIGPFVKQDRAHNPLRYPLIGSTLKPTSVDLDNDGDYDIVVGENSGYIRIYFNVGDQNNPAFNDYLALDETQSPIDGYGGAPAFADLNGDGNLDLIFGEHNASVDRILYFTGNGGIPGDETNPLLFTQQSGVWDNVTKMGNPFDGISLGGDLTVHFVNFDGDADLDVLIGSNYYYTGPGSTSLKYFVNDGESNFSESPFPTTPLLDTYASANNHIVPQLVDIDEDGNVDLIIGNQLGQIRLFRGDGVNYTEQTGPWDSVLKTGNPFNAIDPGGQAAPLFVDLDNDGDLDLVLGYYKYFGEIELSYFENEGNAVFKEKVDLENPFGGVTLDEDAVPYFVDIDGDGDLDALLGGKYGVKYYKKGGNGFIEAPEEDNPFADIDFSNNGAKPVLIDLDGDGDLDLVNADYYGNIDYYENIEGDYIESETSPFDDIYINWLGTIELVDIDNDGDLDLFAGNYGTIDFYRNEGDNKNPVFKAPEDPTENPLDASYIPEFGTLFNHQMNLRFVDVDNDGDFDLILGAYYYIDDYTKGDQVYFVENTGTPEAAAFVLHTSPLVSNPDYSPYPGFVDADEDGDLDFFLGDRDGNFDFFVNNNPAPVPTVSGVVLNYAFGSGPSVLDANLTLADQDNDNIVQATVSIQSFQPGNETLTFTPEAPVTGNFNTTTGILTLQGTASIAIYQSILRTVAYEYTGPDPGARKGKTGKIKALVRNISFAVTDADKTNGQTGTRTVNVASEPKNPPAITQTTLASNIKGSVSIDLSNIITDPDGNLDPLSFKVIPNISPTPARIGNATLINTLLTIDYSATDFAGIDYVTIEACDLSGLCSNAELSVRVGGGVIVHNGISPDGDGKNDYMEIVHITTLSPENKVTIFSRWGDKVFEIDNYDNLNRRFEGKSDNGKELSSGVYFYKIQFLNGQPEQTGYLTLKR